MKKELVCSTCGFIGTPKQHTKGSIAIEILLWVMLILPGLIYSIWRLTSRQDVCPKCRNATMIPTDTPVGQKLAAETKKTEWQGVME